MLWTQFYLLFSSRFKDKRSIEATIPFFTLVSSERYPNASAHCDCVLESEVIDKAMSNSAVD